MLLNYLGINLLVLCNKLGYFISVRYFSVTLKRPSLLKRMGKFSPDFIFVIDYRGLYYKTFYDRKLRMFIIS